MALTSTLLVAPLLLALPLIGLLAFHVYLKITGQTTLSFLVLCKERMEERKQR
jgi:hypothetical protein